MQSLVSNLSEREDKSVKNDVLRVNSEEGGCNWLEMRISEGSALLIDVA